MTDITLPQNPVSDSSHHHTVLSVVGVLSRLKDRFWHPMPTITFLIKN
ncbi:MAG: hypothetical protein WBB28_26705 [Crinalium sp.]